MRCHWTNSIYMVVVYLCLSTLWLEGSVLRCYQVFNCACQHKIDCQHQLGLCKSLLADHWSLLHSDVYLPLRVQWTHITPYLTSLHSLNHISHIPLKTRLHFKTYVSNHNLSVLNSYFSMKNNTRINHEIGISVKQDSKMILWWGMRWCESKHFFNQF